MKRTFTLALTAVLGTMFATSAFAQEAFPDTPENHWAFEALAKMRAAGLLTGYPDGLYRGARPASRYEMAVALYALYQHLKGISDGLDSRISALEGGPKGTGDLDELRKQLAALQADVNGMKAWGDDIANLKKMVSTFEKELASMGVDIEALKKGLNDLADRVAALEKRKPAVDVHGNVGLFIMSGYSEDGNYGISVDGRPLGVSQGDGEPSSFQRDLNVFHNAELRLSGTNETGPKWKAALAINNIVNTSSILDGGPSGGGIGLSSVAPGVPFFDGNDTDVYFQEFEVSDKAQFLGLDFGYRIGRIGHQVHPYIFKRGDNSPYFKDDRWDDGNWYFDGAHLAFNFGSTNLNIFGGRTSGRNSVNGSELNGMVAGQSGHVFEPGGDTGNNPDRPRGYASGAISVDTMLGAHLNIPITDKGKLNLAYLILDSNSLTTLSGSSLQADRVAVFGGDVSFDLGGFGLNAGYSQTNLMEGETAVVDEDNAAWWVSLGRDYDRWGFKVGYRSIDPQFNAPGSWGRIGIWWNPSDIEGFWAKANFNVNDKLSLEGGFGSYTGRDLTVNGGSGLSNDDELMHWRLDLKYGISENTTFWLGTEQVNWDLQSRGLSFDGGETEEIWYNIGLMHRMNDKSAFSIHWQISDYDSKGTAGMNPFPSFFSGSGRAKGGLITSQLSIKF